MTNYQMRCEVANMYPSMKWKQRVNNMPDSQVYAIYKTNQQRKQLQRNEATKKIAEGYRQMTMFDPELNCKEEG